MEQKIDGRLIRVLRDRLGETQAQFAARLRIDQATISRWETCGIPQKGVARIAIEQLCRELTLPMKRAVR